MKRFSKGGQNIFAILKRKPYLRAKKSYKRIRYES